MGGYGAEGALDGRAGFTGVIEHVEPELAVWHAAIHCLPLPTGSAHAAQGRFGVEVVVLLSASFVCGPR
jgi:hypothetical protein